MTYKEDRIDRIMTVWALTIAAMIIIGLPVALCIGMSLSSAERVESVEKPTAYYNLAEYAPEFNDFESTEYRPFTNMSPDAMYRHSDNGKWYYSAPGHTYRIAQSITGLMLGTEGTSINYITPYVVASICEHGEYQHVATCCNQ